MIETESFAETLTKGKKDPNVSKNGKKLPDLNIYEYLRKLDVLQFKIFYGALVHYWVKYQFFISKQNFFNLWCELNLCCHELDESFPDQFEDHELICSFCKAHPYYFIDRLPINLLAKLFAESVDDHAEILVNIVKRIMEADIYAAYTYANHALGLDEDVDALAMEAQEHIKCFS